MKIVRDWPPNIARLRQKFPFITDQVIFAYGDIIFAPKAILTPSLIAHEEVHSSQQGDNVAQWWDNYIDSVEFRLEQEVAAHRAEYRRAIKTKRGKHKTQQILTEIAGKLSAPLYGSLLSLPEAITLIRGYS